MKRHAVPFVAVLASLCTQTPPPASRANVWFLYSSGKGYAAAVAIPIVRYDDGSGERVVTTSDFAAEPYPGWNLKRETRTEGTLAVVVDILSPRGDTLSHAAATFPLAPDQQWQIWIKVGPRYSFPDQGRRPAPGTYVASPLRSPSSPASAPTDSLYLTWAATRLSGPQPIS